jgi:hypothetical protein
MNSVDTALLQLNAVIEEEIDDVDQLNKEEQGKFFLKIRFFPSFEDLNNNHTKVEMEDTFYDSSDFRFLSSKPMMFYRVRVDKTKNTEKIVKQYSHVLNNRSHCFVEQVIPYHELSELKLSPYLSFKFTRSILSEEVESSKYLDCISGPVSYAVVSYKIFINNIQELTGDMVREMVSKHCPPTMLLIYSKFQYSLQCSPYYRKYEEIFPDDTMFSRVEAEMKTKDVAKYQDYLLSFSKITHFQFYSDFSGNSAEAYKEVAKYEEAAKRGLFKITSIGVVNEDDDDDYF